jgi:hypothetical protein
MRIVIENEVDITMVEAQTIEHTKDTNTITVFDFNDNSGTIVMDDSFALKRVIQDLKTNISGVVKIQGVIIWE